MCAAYAHELPRYGIKDGKTNFPAAYATGLLLARRLLKKLNLDSKYQGAAEVKGEDYNVDAIPDGPHPFTALLDVGLRRTTTGSKLFAALKGATDGGIDIPHSVTRFVGYDKEQKKLIPETLRKHIFGGHIADYMKALKDEDSSKYQKQFSKYIKSGIKSEDMEALYKKAHAAIRKDPSPTAKKAKDPKKVPKRYNKLKLSLAQRKDKIRQKIAARARKQDTQ